MAISAEAMTSSGEEALRRRTEELGERVGRLRAFGSLRRTLRHAKDVTEIALAAQEFASDALRATHFAIYLADKEDTDFELISPPELASDLPMVIERSGNLAQELAKAPSVRDAEMLVGLREIAGVDAVALSLRSSSGQLLAIGVVAGERLDAEMLDEIAFDVEGALSAHMLAKLRAEELAVLEIQERELVGLLRDVEARDTIIQRDLEEARQFQRKMLGAPPWVRGASVEVVYTPLGLVGGDLYAVSVDGDRLRLFVADATGHGVRASLTTMFIKSGYEAVRAKATEPAMLLAALNDAIASTYRSSEMLFSAVCVDIDLPTGRVLTSSAAHPALCIVQGGKASLIEGGGAFLGLRTGMKFTTHERMLGPGDAVYLLTDGFVEARKQNEQFGDDRLRATILKAHEEGTLAGAALVEAVTAFLDGTPLDDDGTFVGVRFGVEDSPAPSVRDPKG
jgi:sigma-B regulation protein RsbU (phosphoserine phosphatase)